ASVFVLADRERRGRAQAVHRTDDMKTPVAQPHQPAMVQACPDAAITTLKPRAHAVAGQTLGCGQSLGSSIWCDMKKPVAIVVEPQSAIAIFVHSQTATG